MEKEQSKIQPLKEGEKYLNISILGGQIKLALFPNKNKSRPSDPDYQCSGAVCWVNAKGSKAPIEAPEQA